MMAPWPCAQGNGHSHGHSDSVVKIKSLPFDATQLDIIQFFEAFRLKPNGVQLVVRSDNKPTGEVRARLMRPRVEGRAGEDGWPHAMFVMCDARMLVRYARCACTPLGARQPAGHCSTSHAAPWAHQPQGRSPRGLSGCRARWQALCRQLFHCHLKLSSQCV